MPSNGHGRERFPYRLVIHFNVQVSTYEQISVSFHIVMWGSYSADTFSTSKGPCPRKRNSKYPGFFQSLLGTVCVPIHPLVQNRLTACCGFRTWRWISKTPTLSSGQGCFMSGVLGTHIRCSLCWFSLLVPMYVCASPGSFCQLEKDL